MSDRGDDSTIKTPNDDAKGEFFETLRADVDRGESESLQDFVDRFPDVAEAIASAWAQGSQRHRSEGQKTRRPGEVAVSGFEEKTKVVGHYRLLEELGRGGQAVVYRAEDMRVPGRSVALKLLHGLSALNAPMLLSRFKREAMVTSRLDHATICPVYEVGLDEDPYIAMKLIEGETLARVIARGRAGDDASTIQNSKTKKQDVTGDVRPTGRTPSRDQASAPAQTVTTPRTEGAIFAILKMIEAVARGLHVAHEAGVVHRDVKPGNVMIQGDGTPVILDFGLATDSDDASPDLTQSGQMLGTPAYMAPEQVLGRRSQIDRRTDVYCLGVTLYECLTQVRPFDEPTRDVLFHAITFKDPVDPRRLNAQVNRDLAAVILKSLEKHPNQRFQTAEGFAEELRRIYSHEPIVSRPVSFFGRHMRWIRRNPGWAVAGYGIILALAIAAGVFAWKGQEAARESEEKGRALKEKKTALAEKQAALTQKTEALAAKEAAVTAYDRLADVTLWQRARAEADTFYPVSPELVPRIETWLETYGELFARVKEHEKTLETVRARAAPYTEAERAKEHSAKLEEVMALEASAKSAREKEAASPEDDALADAADAASAAAVSARRAYMSLPQENWDFGAATTLQFQHDALTKLVSEMRPFLDEKVGEMAEIKDRLDASRTIYHRTITNHERQWNEAISRIASNPKYGGLKLEPQVGLIPLGPDPESTLEEFGETLTGVAPQRNAEGRIEVTERVAMVFVLIPGGRFLMGAQRSDPNGPNYDPDVLDEESPVHSVRISAFFLSKYEMTQGQWTRSGGRGGTNPSSIQSTGFYGEYKWATTDLRRPVEQVSWIESDERARRLGYVLPTESQWEYAARSGSSKRYVFGEDLTALEGYANVMDRESARLFGEPRDFPFDDAYRATSPVGTFKPNGFGLHDVLGNTAEWCADRYDKAEYRGRLAEVADPNGPSASASRVLRGGSWRNPPTVLRVSSRDANTPVNRGASFGLRLARTPAPP